MTGVRVLVTGGAGFIGSHVVDLLVDEGHEVAVVDDLSTGQRMHVHPQAAIHIHSIISKTLNEVFERVQPEVVVHLAAQSHVPTSLRDPLLDGHINVLGTVNVLERCQRYGVRKIVYASSAAVYGSPRYLPVDELHPIEPLSFYGISKYTPELYIRQYADLYGIGYTILRFANVYGPRQDPSGEGGVVSIFVDKLSRGEAVYIDGDGEQTRDFVYVGDVAAAVAAALVRGNGETVNISTGIPTSVNDLWRAIHRLAGSDTRARYREPRIGDIRESYLANDKARSVLRWAPETMLEAGLEKTLADYSRRAAAMGTGTGGTLV